MGLILTFSIVLHWFKQFNPFITMALLGFSSGLPLLLTGSTLSFWLKTEGISLTEIGLFSIIVLPYCLKFLWAPLVDQWKVPFLTKYFGLRRTWLLITQIGVSVILLFMGQQNPQEDLLVLGGLGFCLSFMAATQDMVLLAYQADVLDAKHYGSSEATTVFGYRIGMLTSGAGALYLSTVVNWSDIYGTMACLMLVGLLTTLFMHEPQPSNILPLEKGHKEKVASFSGFIQHRVIHPFSSFCQQKGWFPILLLMMHYKLGDNMIGSLSAIFYHDLGFSPQDIASASKVFGMWATVLGGFIGGAMLMKIGLLRSLFIFALIHGASMLMYVFLIHSGQDKLALYSAIAIENVTGGMRTTALLSFRLALVDGRFGATHMALLTSVMHLGRLIYATPSGALVENIGWESFFYLVTLSTLPVLGLVVWVKRAWMPLDSRRKIYVSFNEDNKQVQETKRYGT